MHHTPFCFATALGRPRNATCTFCLVWCLIGRQQLLSYYCGLYPRAEDYLREFNVSCVYFCNGMSMSRRV